MEAAYTAYAVRREPDRVQIAVRAFMSVEGDYKTPEDNYVPGLTPGFTPVMRRVTLK